MKKILFFIVVGVAFFFLPAIARADVTVFYPVANEKTKIVADCVSFKNFENDLNYSFFVELINKSTDRVVYTQYVEPIKDNVCYKLYSSNEILGVAKNLWSDSLPGIFFARIRMVDKQFISPKYYDRIVTADLRDGQYHGHNIFDDAYGRWFETALNASFITLPVWQGIDVVSYYIPDKYGNDSFATPYFEVKSSSTIKSISSKIIFKSATTIAPSIYAEVADKDFNRSVLTVSPDQAADLSSRGEDEQGRKLIAIGFKKDQEYVITYDKQYIINFTDGSQKIYNQSDLDKFLISERPEYTNDGSGQDLTSSYDENYVYNRTEQIIYFWRLIWPLLLTIAVEFIIFFLFGSRRIRNYLWLLLANLISYPTALGTIDLLDRNLNSWSILANVSVYRFLVSWFLAELLVILIEFGVMWLALRKYYQKKQIILFVSVANAITALIGLAITYYLYIK